MLYTNNTIYKSIKKHKLHLTIYKQDLYTKITKCKGEMFLTLVVVVVT